MTGPHKIYECFTMQQPSLHDIWIGKISISHE